MPSLPPQVQKILTDLDKKLHEPGILTNALDTVEKKTTLKRLHVVAGCMVVYALYLLFGSWAQFFCNLTGFFYPAYLSIKAIESHVKEDDTQWLTYWVVFALLNVVEFFSETILYYFPFYWLLKCVFLLWLYMPASPGALLVYDRLIRPFHLQYQGHIEDKLSSASQCIFSD
ncbi:Receptor expression-enhancing protein [Meloidogyne graminicola]|uniref:Receptor expression-enhancing protein n=1 Tax=Meloidogyne graminicola TaxID=189291 RepID=A0A8T0A0H1_9BILA|nr:Receptor expression-enhancing protein [Meloidogyne graminicola]